mgnify:CR=1 FL=1
MIFDTHAHYDDEQFDADRTEILAELGPAGVGTVVNVGADILSSKRSLELAQKYDFIYAALGVHPSDVSCLNEETFAWLEGHIHDPKVVAIGEIGLDYYWEKDSEAQEQQKYWFRKQLALALRENMPVIIHSREAAQETYEILAEMDISSIPVVVHCYSYSPEMAKRFMDLGCYLGIGGVLTFKNAKKLKEVAKDMPLERILLETDCPYLAPEPNRGKRNSSLNLPYVVETLAQLRDCAPEELIAETEKNARRFYRISEA